MISNVKEKRGPCGMGGARQEAQGPAGEVAAVQHHTQAGEVRVWGGQG